MLKIEYDDGSFMQIEGNEDTIIITQCAKSGKKTVMSSSKITKDQAKDVLNFMIEWLK